MDIPHEDHLQSSKTKPTRRKRNKGMCLEDRPVLEPNAAGIDGGARERFVAAPPGGDEHRVGGVHELHRRSAPLGGLAGTVRGDHRAYGSDWGLLESAPRNAGAAARRALTA